MTVGLELIGRCILFSVITLGTPFLVSNSGGLLVTLMTVYTQFQESVFLRPSGKTRHMHISCVNKNWQSVHMFEISLKLKLHVCSRVNFVTP